MMTLKLTKQILLLSNEGYLIFLSSKCASSSIRRMALKKLSYSDNESLYIRDTTQLKYYRQFEWLHVVRDPFDRIASLFVDKVQRGVYKAFRPLGVWKDMSFEDFIDIITEYRHWRFLDSHLWPQTILAKHFWGNITVLRVEDFPGDWPIELPELDRENVSARNINYKSLWTDRLKSLVRRRYYKDFSMLPYEY